MEGMSTFELIFAEEKFLDMVHVEAVSLASSATDAENCNFRSPVYVYSLYHNQNCVAYLYCVWSMVYNTVVNKIWSRFQHGHDIESYIFM